MITGISIKLAFFFDGPADISSLSSWVERRSEYLGRNAAVFYEVERKPLSSLVGDIFPCMILQVLEETARKMGCTVSMFN